MGKPQQPDWLTIDAKAALDAGMSYGKYMAQKPSRPTEPISLSAVSATSATAVIVYCRICGAPIDTALTKCRKYCSEACRKVQHNRYMR